ncbi:hypothetical protein AFLA_006850 [Aspergillus flavus NRRL3357]|nr:hypothetical protein AFLA_006850 [Aspergillus flavus NRRL3357]
MAFCLGQFYSLEYTDLSDGVLCEPDYKEATRGLATRNTTTQKKASSRLLISHYAHLSMCWYTQSLRRGNLRECQSHGDLSKSLAQVSTLVGRQFHFNLYLSGIRLSECGAFERG